MSPCWLRKRGDMPTAAVVTLLAIMLALSLAPRLCPSTQRRDGRRIAPTVTELRAALGGANIDTVFIHARHNEQYVSHYHITNAETINGLLKAVGEGRIEGLRAATPDSGKNTTEQIELNSRAGSIIYLDYYGSQKTLMIPYFFYRSDVGPLETGGPLSKIEREIVVTRASKIAVKMGQEFDSMLLQLKTPANQVK